MKILKHLKKYRLECFLAPLFKMIEATFELLVPLVIAEIVDNGIPMHNTSLIINCTLVLLGFALIGLVCAITAQYFSAKAATGFAREIKLEIFTHIESLSYQELDQIGTSTLITRMTSDVNQMQTGVNMFLRIFLRSPFVVFGAIVMAFLVDAQTALIFAVAIPILAIIIFTILLISIPLFKKIQAKLDLLLARTRQNLKGVRVIRAFNNEKTEKRSFEAENETFTQVQIFVGKISALLNPLTYLIVNLAIIAIIYLGSHAINNGFLLQGSVIAQYNYMSQILVELIKLANLIITLTKASACGKRVKEVLEIKNSQCFLEKSILTKNPSENIIEFKDVNFIYPSNQANALEKINFTLKKGQTLGIIGGTGAGKSTLINLLPRYYDHSSGEILIDGNDIKCYSKADLRKKIGIVLQKAVLFNGTLRDNLTMTDSQNITDTEIMNALKISQGLDIITKKSDGLDTVVFQGGKNFSGGEAQRLSIARTLLGKPDILILDDSASALDYLTDAKLKSELKKLPLTTIIISQRFSSVMDADMILVMDEGKITDFGKHEELLKSSIIYQEIYQSQKEDC